MNEGTSVLLGLEDEFAVLQLERIDPDTVKIVMEVTGREGGCPGCGVFSSRVKERPLVRLKDLPAITARVNASSCGGSNGAWCAANDSAR